MTKNKTDTQHHSWQLPTAPSHRLEISVLINKNGTNFPVTLRSISCLLEVSINAKQYQVLDAEQYQYLYLVSILQLVPVCCRICLPSKITFVNNWILVLSFVIPYTTCDMRIGGYIKLVQQPAGLELISVVIYTCLFVCPSSFLHVLTQARVLLKMQELSESLKRNFTSRQIQS